MLKIWGRRNSANVQKVLWLTDELNLTYEQVNVGGNFGGLTEARLSRSQSAWPHSGAAGRRCLHLGIPCHSRVTWRRNRQGEILAARGRYAAQNDQWMDWAQTSFQPAFLNGIFWGYYRTPEPQRNWPAIKPKASKPAAGCCT